MVWVEGTLKLISCPSWAGTPSTIAGCSKPCSAWPWTLPGITGQPQLLSGQPIPGPHYPYREEFFFLKKNYPADESFFHSSPF